MKIRVLILPAIFFAFAAKQVAAGDAKEPDTILTLHGAVEYAINYGLSMRMAVNRRQSSTMDLFASRQALYPTARATLYAGGRQSLCPSDIAFSASASAGTEYELSPSRFLFYRAGRNRSKAAQHDFDQKRKDAAAEVILQYVKTVGAKKLIEAEERNIDYQQRKLEEIEALFEQGIKSRSDVLQQKTALFEARTRLLNAAQEYYRVKLTVLDILGLRFSDRYRFDTAGVVGLFSLFSADTCGQAVTPYRETDEIAAQRCRVAAAGAALAGSRYNYIPALSFSAGWSAEAAGPEDHPGATALQAGVSLGIPIFDKKQRWLQVKNAEINLQNEQLELERLERAFALAVERAALDDKMAEERTATAAVRCAAAQEALQATEERYNVGASTIVELNAVRTSYAEAQSELVQARFDRIVRRIILLHATDRIDQVIALINMRKTETGY